jgi:hypothetical protein
MSDGTEESGKIANVRTYATVYGFQKELEDFAASKNIDLGKAPPLLKKKRKVASTAQTTATITDKICTHDHDDIANYSSQGDKKYFDGSLETHYGMSCKDCGKKFGNKDGEDMFVPSAKEPAYI